MSERIKGLVERLLVASEGIDKVDMDRRSMRRGYENILLEAAEYIENLEAQIEEFNNLQAENGGM